MLIMQGGRDYQVLQKDYEGWKMALRENRDATFKLYPIMNHLFIEGTGTPTPDEYYKIGHVNKAVVDDLAEWILARAK
jgi:hypothetical protein